MDFWSPSVDISLKNKERTCSFSDLHEANLKMFIEVHIYSLMLWFYFISHVIPYYGLYNICMWFMSHLHTYLHITWITYMYICSISRTFMAILIFKQSQYSYIHVHVPTTVKSSYCYRLTMIKSTNDSNHYMCKSNVSEFMEFQFSLYRFWLIIAPCKI
jgi:hypothetical protein